MKNFFRDLGYSIRSFFQGRYGTDLLSWVMLIAGLILSMISGYISVKAIQYIVSLMSTALVVFSIYRSYSRNFTARQNELAAFKRIFSGPITSIKMIKQRKADPQHLYLKCPNCKTVMRVPRGKGRIIITCPKCQNKVEIKS